jgi:hypothetical protein
MTNYYYIVFSGGKFMSTIETNNKVPEMATKVTKPETPVNPLQAYFRRPALYISLH